MTLKKITGVLKYSLKDINLKICLTGGQSFRWNQNNKNEFIGVIDDKIFILNQAQNSIDYSAFYDGNQTINSYDEEYIENILINYLRLDVDLLSLYNKWSTIDPIFKNKLTLNTNLHGIRLLRQHPIENLFSFICSSNNNIKRITKMIKALCLNFGNLIGNLNGENYFQFPTVESLSQFDVESKLRKLNFGYRAKFIQQAAIYLKENFKNENEFLNLIDKSYTEVFNELIKVPGIGNKIADCICLMSFNKLEAVPIDTHMLNVAYNTYEFMKNDSNMTSKNNNKQISKKQYLFIGNKFREMWGIYAGWVQAVLFIDDLKEFSKLEAINNSESSNPNTLKKEIKRLKKPSKLE